MNLEEFLDKLSKHFLKELQPEVLDIYTKCLGHLSEEQFQIAFDCVIWKNKFFPTPEEILEPFVESGDQLFDRLVGASCALAIYRYDQPAMWRKRKELVENMPQILQVYIRETGLQLLSLGDMDYDKLEVERRKFLKWHKAPNGGQKPIGYIMEENKLNRPNLLN